ncbi:hypothetical protein SAMN02745181_2750 [Rubritalea squalenifaciens DSM 18772]|uniref:Uncharacterized protein n=1 Tax=Rubritalea squalenifaciens DSM 18772 TaxID=1123071 RepID=A0A1M6MIW9_9BACT|nr:hypothetical protein [Rubritalea squalenifaciens]SHJ83397.1 hypothetical protein SAMN02745181_2750 [Rubritalea squalenifaciens DSM 18772]
MNDLEKKLATVGRVFLEEEMGNSFQTLKKIRLRGLRKVIEWINKLDDTAKLDLISDWYSDGRGEYYEQKRIETMTQAGIEPRYSFEGNKKFLRKLKSEYSGVKFSDFSSDSICADSSCGELKFRTLITANSRRENITCMNFVTSGNGKPSKFSLLPMCRIYGYDAWKAERLDVDDSVREVSEVLDKCYELASHL